MKERVNGICPNCLAYLRQVPEMGWIACPHCGAEVVAKLARGMYFHDPDQGKEVERDGTQGD